VLPPQVVARIVIEAGVTEGWHRIAGSAGRVIGLDRYGESAPATELFRKFGFTAERIAEEARGLLA